MLATAGLGMAQDQPQDVRPWRSATGADQNSAQTADQNSAQADPQAGAQAPTYQNQQQPQYQPPPQYQQQPPQYQNQYPPQQQQQGPVGSNPGAFNPGAPNGNFNQAPPPPNYGAPIPAHLTIKPGTYVTVRVNQWLSSDKNQKGDAFTASLAQPLIVDGVVVAERGQTVGGQVTEAKKAGRVEGTSSLGVQLTNLTLADGQSVPIQSQMINRNGPTSVGRDVGAVAGTTAVGAAIGAAADWGTGAAIGAGAGAAAGLIGVLLTRGRPTVIYPESVLTFRIDAPADISTEQAPQAFRYVDTQDYGGPAGQGPPPRPAYGAYGAPPPAYGYAGPAPAPYPYPYAYPGYGYPYYPYPYFGGLYFGIGGRYYGGFYRGYRR